MGRPGCRQCCDDDVQICTIEPTTRYIDSKNQDMRIELDDFKESVRLISDGEPRGKPDDYDDYIIDDEVIEGLYNDGYFVAKEDSILQRVISTVDKEDQYSFTATLPFLHTEGEVNRVEVKTKNREFFFRLRKSANPDIKSTISIELPGLETDIPSRFASRPASESYSFDLSPDIVNIYSDLDQDFSFNMKEEIGDYLPEEALEYVEFSRILNPGYMGEQLDDLEVDKAVDLEGFEFSNIYFSKFEVYSKDVKSKVKYLLVRENPAASDVAYKDHRTVGGVVYVGTTDKTFIDKINDIKKETKIRETLKTLMTELFEDYEDWEVLESGSGDASTKKILSVTFIERIVEYVENGIQDETYEKMAYIGTGDQQRDDQGFKTRTYDSEIIPKEDYMQVLTNITEDEEFLDRIIGYVDVSTLDDVSLSVDYIIAQGDSEAKMTYKDDLLEESLLPTSDDNYTFNNVIVKIIGDPGVEDVYEPMPKIGEAGKGQLKKIAAYREKYYLSMKYTEPNGGAFLNGETIQCTINISGYGVESSNDVVAAPEFGDDLPLLPSITDTITLDIGKQLYVRPLCGSIVAASQVSTPRMGLNGVTIDNNQYDIVYDIEDEDYTRYTQAYDLENYQYEIGYSCGSPWQADYSKIENIVSVASPNGWLNDLNSFSSRFNGPRYRFPTYERKRFQCDPDFVRIDPNTDREIWSYHELYPEYGNWSEEEPIVSRENVWKESSDREVDRALELSENLLSQFSGINFISGNLTQSLVSVASSYWKNHLRYHSFEDNVVETRVYISQWPSKKFLTIDMEPNKGDINYLKREDGTILNRVDTVNDYSPASDVFLANGGNYHNGKVYITSGSYSSSPVEPDEIFVGDSLHSVNCDIRVGSATNNGILKQSYTGEYPVAGFLIVDDNFFLNNDLSDLIEIYEGNIAIVDVVNTEKKYYLNGTRSVSIPVFRGNVSEKFVSDKITYIELLKNNGQSYEDIGWSYPDGGGSLADIFNVMCTRLTAGTGTTSTNLSDNISGLYRQTGQRIWDSNGYFQDADIDFGISGIASNYLTSSYTPRNRSSFLREGSVICVSCDSVGQNIHEQLYEECTPNEGSVIYNLEDNIFNDVGYTYIPVNGDPEQIVVDPSCTQISLNSNLNYTPAGSGQRISYNKDNSPSESIKTAVYSGNFSATYSWSNCGTGCPPFYSDDGDKLTNSPGFHIYQDSVVGSDYYYYNYKYKVSNAINLRSIPVTAGGGFLNLGQITDGEFYIYALPLSSLDCPFSQYPFPTASCRELLEQATKYGPWFSSVPFRSAEFRCQAQDIGCCLTLYAESITQILQNSTSGYETYFFVEDQGHSTIDIRGFRQKNTTVTLTEFPTRNESLDLYAEDEDFIETLEFEEMILNWGDQE